MTSVFNLALYLDQAQAVLSALEREVEECVKADFRDRQSFGFGPIIHEDSARDRAYLDARRFAATSTILAMKEAGVPYAAESLERARTAHDRFWAAFQREQEEKALFARLDKDQALIEAFRQFSIALNKAEVRPNAKAAPTFSGLEKDILYVLSKANAKAPGWASQVTDLIGRAQSLVMHLPTRSATPVAEATEKMSLAFAKASDRAKAEMKAVAQ